MLVQGLVAGVKDSTYTSKKTGVKYEQLAVDIYDSTMGIVPCTMAKDGFVPQEGTRITAEVKSIRKINFGLGYICTIEKVRPQMDDAPIVPPSSGKK